MILQFTNSFSSGDFAWYTFCTLALLVTFVPGTMLVCSAATGQPGPWTQASRWLPILSGCGLAWVMLIFSLAFAPSPTEMPSAAPPPVLDLRVLLETSTAEDSVDRFGRGGWIGGLDFANLTVLAPEGDPEQPVFPSRRPAHQIPLATFLAYQTAVYLGVVGGLGILVLPNLTWPRVFVFLLLWSGLVYAPMAHWVWGDGWLALRGAVDPGGGLLPLAIGVAAAAASCVGRRRHQATVLPRSEPPAAGDQDSERTPDGRLTAGVLLLCLSHLILVTSFSVYVTRVAALASGLLNLLLAGSAGCVAGCLFRATTRSGASFGAVVGLMAGCAASAGAAGTVSPHTSLLLGVVSAGVALACIGATAEKTPSTGGRLLAGLLAIPAAIGLLIPGLMGVSSVAMKRLDGTVVTSLVDGDLAQLTHQTFAVAAVAGLVFVGTALLLLLLQWAPSRTTQPETTPTQP